MHSEAAGSLSQRMIDTDNPRPSIPIRHPVDSCIPFYLQDSLGVCPRQRFPSVMTAGLLARTLILSIVGTGI